MTLIGDKEIEMLAFFEGSGIACNSKGTNNQFLKATFPLIFCLATSTDSLSSNIALDVYKNGETA